MAQAAVQPPLPQALHVVAAAAALLADPPQEGQHFGTARRIAAHLRRCEQSWTGRRAAAAAAAAAAGGAARSSTAPVPRLRVSPEATAGPGKSRSLAEEEEIWQSYRIDEEKVPEATLALIWRRAVDPKQRDGEIAQLPSIPRLTVTKREVQQLPVVHDIDHWRQVNRHRREQRKLREETEQFTSLGEMLHTLFGERPPPRLRMDGLRSSFQSVLTRNKSSSSVSRWLLARDVPAEGEAPMPPEAGAADDGVDASAPLPAAGFKGVRQRGRRNAVDMGEVEDGLVPEPDMWRRSQGTKLMRGLEALRSVISHGAEEEEVDRALEKVLAGSARVQARCQRKVRRMHERFMAKKWQLSGRLQRRVQRLQLDFQEIHDKKVSLILPGSLLPSSEPSTSTRPEGSDLKASVLTYLKHKRRHVEHDRKTRHATYLHQVERFQSHLRLLADPNRPPERGEVYLSECFRHVLSAGLIVDNDYFFRVIANMDGQDFEGPCTVNLLAACCDAFDIDLRRYWLFLRQKAVPKCTPRPCPENVRSWQEDFAPWCGVTLQDIREVVEQIVPTDSETSGDDIPSSAMDPLPFSPVCPKEVPPSSELVSRDDGPLRSIIDSAPLDSVLERYHLSKGDVRANRAEASARRRSASWSHDGRSRRSSSATSGGTGFMTPGTESEDPEESAMESLAPEVALATEPRPPLGPGAAASEARRALSTQRARRPPPRAYPTLRAAVQLENAASAASRERRRRPPKAADSPPETPVLGPAPEWPRFSPFPERLE
mmetsp:Transcript_40626/g.126644  ORF Transcript_40626/g.126644 Transcript_40626/m.126644 type:complete len:771 (+) Transcript_40626:342-2654(+)